jgi:hypothetical protein
MEARDIKNDAQLKLITLTTDDILRELKAIRIILSFGLVFLGSIMVYIFCC